MTDRLRRCEARDQYGHRCRRHLHHVVEVANSDTGLALPDGEHDNHVAFGRSWTGREKRKPGNQRPTTPGWSRKGATETRTTILARIRAAIPTPITGIPENRP